MIGLGSIVFFIVSIFAAGSSIADAAFPNRTGISRLERVAFGGALSMALWLAIAWSLSFARWLTRPALLACAVVALAAAAAYRIRYRSAADKARVAWPEILLLLPVLAYVAFLFWKAFVTPASAPDALTYHLPRAAEIFQAGTVRHFDLPDERVNRLPANYELLIATMFLLEDGDIVHEIVSILFFVLFIIATAALARQWFGPGLHVVVTVLLAATMPVLLLQGTLQKNDTMVAAFVLVALLALGRWLESARVEFAVLVGVAMIAAAGTKPQGVVIAAGAFLPFVVATGKHLAARAIRWRHVLAIIAIGIALIPLLGGAGYVIAQQNVRAGAAAVEHVAPVAYGEWQHLWIIPTLVLCAPFLADFRSILVPWNGEHWLWGASDPFASHLGIPFTILALAFPFAVFALRKMPGELRPRTRLLISLVALGAAAAILPVRAPIIGYVSGYPRYLLFAAPIVIVTTSAAIVGAIERRKRRAAIVLAAFIALLAVQAEVWCALNDKFAPLSVLLLAAEHPGIRWIPIMPQRATILIDAVADLDDKIDVHGGPDTWTYPLYGAALRRSVHFIDDASQIRPDAQWVVVERAFNAVWGAPGFRHIRDFEKYLGHGQVIDEDLKVIRQLARDPRFQLVHLDEGQAQAIFRRVADRSR